MKNEEPKQESQTNNTNNVEKKLKYLDVQNKILDILTSEERPDKIEEFEIKSEIYAPQEKMNYHDDFIKLISPILKDKKILEPFCAVNANKRFLKEIGVNVDFTGVDINDRGADIVTDFREIDKHIEPSGQFDLVFSFGGVPDVINHSVLNDYLKEDGIFIISMSDDVFDMNSPLMRGEKGDPENHFVKEFERHLEYFEPQIVVKVLDQKSASRDRLEKMGRKISGDEVYIIFKKKKK